MKEIGPEHTLSYRQEVLNYLFGYIRSANSFFVIGGSNVGKTRLMDFIMRGDVQMHYLGARAQTTWLIRVDFHRYTAEEDWRFYELFLNSMMLGCGQYENTTEIFEQLVDLDSQVMETRDFSRALRLFELAIHMLCKNKNLSICFLLDEFDEMYRTMPHEFFSQLRAVQDANLNQVCYGLFLRNLPERLRAPTDNESFYELFSHHMIGLGPYTHDDAIRVIEQLEERKKFPLSPNWREAIFLASGGHPGLIQALLSLMINSSSAKVHMEDLLWIAKQEVVKDECQKLWESLSNEEQFGLLELVRNNFDLIPQQVVKLLTAKRLMQQHNKGFKVFSLIFEVYLRSEVLS